MVNVLDQFRRVDGYHQKCDTITWKEDNSGKWKELVMNQEQNTDGIQERIEILILQ